MFFLFYLIASKHFESGLRLKFEFLIAALSMAKSRDAPAFGNRSLGPWRFCGMDVVDRGNGRNSLYLARC